MFECLAFDNCHHLACRSRARKSLARSLPLTLIFVIALYGCGSGGGGEAPSSKRIPSNERKVSGPVAARDILLSWNIPDSRLDGSDLELYEIAGYAIYMAESSGTFLSADPIIIPDPHITEHRMTAVPAGNYQLSIVTIDITGLESPPSISIEVSF